MIRRRIRSNVVDLGNSQVVSGSNQNETRLRGLAKRRNINRVAGDATMQNRLQRSTTSIQPAFNIVNQSRRSSNLVQRGQFRDASFRQQALSRFDRLNRQDVEDQRYQENRDYRIGRDEESDQRYNDNRDYRIGRDKVSDERYNQGQSRLKRIDEHNAKQSEFSNRLTQKNEQRKDELHGLNIETARMKNQALKSQMNTKRIPKFKDTFKDGALIRQARESGIDVSGFYDDSGNLTRHGEEYLDSVETSYNTNGGDISSALKSGGSGTLLAGQNNISSRIKELEKARAVGEFSDGTSFSGEHELELEDAQRKANDNSSRLFRMNPNTSNPVAKERSQKLKANIGGAIDTIQGIQGDDDFSKILKASALSKYLESNKIDPESIQFLGDSDQDKQIKSAYSKISDIMGQYSSEAIELADKVKDLRGEVESKSTELDNYESGPYDMGAFSIDSELSAKKAELKKAEEKLNKILNKGSK